MLQIFFKISKIALKTNSYTDCKEIAYERDTGDII